MIYFIIPTHMIYFSSVLVLQLEGEGPHGAIQPSSSHSSPAPGVYRVKCMLYLHIGPEFLLAALTWFLLFGPRSFPYL